MNDMKTKMNKMRRLLHSVADRTQILGESCRDLNHAFTIFGKSCESFSIRIKKRESILELIEVIIILIATILLIWFMVTQGR